MKPQDLINRLSVALGVNYSEEQIELAKDFSVPTIAFASPGTGKTHTAVAGLIMAQTYHGIPGKNIYALSFTNAATEELKSRYKKACSKIKISPDINFSTLHSLCARILSTHYMELGLHQYRTKESLSRKSLTDMILGSADEVGYKVTKYNVGQVISSIRELNSSLIFDPEHVKSKYSFKQARIEYDDYMKIRKLIYDSNKVDGEIPVNDVLLTTLELLITKPHIAEQLRKQIKVLLIDESQDLSLLQLKIASYLTDNLIMIGDLKQQIYAFNGACQEIVQQYKTLYPNCREVSLTQSFRCSNEIAEFANDIIRDNNIPGSDDFKGIASRGPVIFDDRNDFESIAESIAHDYYEVNNKFFTNTVMFLYRNNYTAIPVAEALYKHKVPFTVTGYKKAYEVEVIRDLVSIIDMVRCCHMPDYLDPLSMLLPELRRYKSPLEYPVAKLMKQTKKDLFGVKMVYENANLGDMVMDALLDVKEMLDQRAPIRQLFNRIWKLYYENYLQNRELYLEYPTSYYLKLVDCLLDKSFNKFMSDERKKEEWINTPRQSSVRCMTCHSAKGLEADIVHIVSADEGIFPNDKKLDKMLRHKSSIDAARELRNERSLVYVAATRAKKQLVIHSDNISPLFDVRKSGKYDSLDMVYNTFVDGFNDVSEFVRFIRS